MKRKKIESYLGLARRAGKIVSGYQTCLHTISRGNIRLIIVASDASIKTRERFEGLCGRYGVDFEVYGTVDELSAMTGLTGRGIYGITDQNFAEVMIKEIQNEKLIPEE
jgi:ribosomal protein L7Ae-like RNA K-turn-binding protein